MLEPGHTFATITDKISAIVLTKQTPLGWFLGVGLAGLLSAVLFYAIGFLMYQGVGIWGINHPGRLGIGDRQLRVVDRNRPRGNADLRHPAAVAADRGAIPSTVSPRR